MSSSAFRDSLSVEKIDFAVDQPVWAWSRFGALGSFTTSPPIKVL